MSGTKATFLDEFCATRGLGYVRFDYSGHGESSGRFEEGTIGTWVEDAVAIIDRVTEGPLLLVGSSMGGWIMLLAALARPKRIAGLVGLAPAPDFTEALIWNALTDDGRNRLYTIETAADAEAGPWAAVNSFVDIAGNDQTVTYTPEPAGTKRFYRLKVRLVP